MQTVFLGPVALDRLRYSYRAFGCYVLLSDTSYDGGPSAHAKIISVCGVLRRQGVEGVRKDDGVEAICKALIWLPVWDRNGRVEGLRIQEASQQNTFRYRKKKKIASNLRPSIRQRNAYLSTRPAIEEMVSIVGVKRPGKRAM
jgi:hypothetical protein